MTAITLTTDFGTEGYHVGAVKGILLTVNPAAVLVDLCHGIPPGSVAEGAWTLLWNWRYFPPGTIHLAVVDPGVGSRRRALAARAGGHFFVGPDNGILSPVLAAAGKGEVVQITVPPEKAPSLSSTFHGRDVFAPAAGQLSLDPSLEALGGAAGDIVKLPLPEPRPAGEETLAGEIISIDHFGNLITSITSRHLEKAGLTAALRIRLGKVSIDGLSSHYAEGEGGPMALINSSGHLEIAVTGGRADDLLGAVRGDTVHVSSSTLET